LKEAKDDLSKTEIFSPMKGVVSQLNKEKGEMVLGASFQEDVIMVVADLSKMEAEVEVDENDVVNVALDDTVKIEIDAFPDTLFKGTVTRIANTGETRGLGTQEEITNFKVEIGILDKIKGIRPGMSATVDIQVEKHDSVLYVPIQCVAMRSPEDTVKAVDKDTTDKKGKKSQKAKKGKSDKTSDMKKEKDRGKSKSEKEKMVEVVFVVDEGDTARIVPIKTGIASDTDIEILTALEEGKKIVSGPYRILATKIRNGDKIKEEKAKKEENQQKRD
jgi:HlyD family secretion protein